MSDDDENCMCAQASLLARRCDYGVFMSLSLLAHSCQHWRGAEKLELVIYCGVCN